MRTTESNLPLVNSLPADQQQAFPRCTARRWTLGEIITTFAQAGLVIEALEEMALRQSRLPNWFVLVARKS